MVFRNRNFFIIKSIENYVSYEVALKLKDLNFNERCFAIYRKLYKLKENILNLYPGLSDDGYLDLLESNGGNYKESDLYENKIELIYSDYCYNSQEGLKEEECICPTLYDALNWLINEYECYIQLIYEPVPNDINILIQVLFKENNDWDNNSLEIYDSNCNSMNKALNYGIQITIDKINKNIHEYN